MIDYQKSNIINLLHELEDQTQEESNTANNDYLDAEKKLRDIRAALAAIAVVEAVPNNDGIDARTARERYAEVMRGYGNKGKDE